MLGQNDLIIAAYRAGADVELDACCEWIRNNLGMTVGSREWVIKRLYADLRPKPPTLKEQALETLKSIQVEPYIVGGININADLQKKYDIIHRALETIPDTET
jgi:hypothetical protein